MSHWKRVIPHDSIVVLSMNGGEPTLKRIKYTGNDNQWFMSVNADNPNDWPESPRTIIPTDEVVFHGILYAIGNGQFDRAKRNISYWKELKK